MTTVTHQEPVICQKCGVLLFTALAGQIQVFTKHHGYVTTTGPISGECRRCGHAFIIGLKHGVESK